MWSRRCAARPEAYSGVRAERVRGLAQGAEIVPDCPFGSAGLSRPRRGARLRRRFAITPPRSRNYRSPDFDVAAALAANTLNFRETLTRMGERGLRAVVATGSVFEPDEGAGPAPRRAFSPYGLAKGLTFETLRYWGEVLGTPVSKFVIANPFGPFEEPRFVAQAVDVLGQGGTRRGQDAELSARQHPCRSAGAGLRGFRRAGGRRQGLRSVFGPCGYMETQGAFAERLSRELGPRLGFDAGVDCRVQTDFNEPTARINTDIIDAAALGWREDGAWDALAGYYRHGVAARP